MPKDCSLHDASRVAQANVNRAIDKFIELEKQGHAPFVPHLSHYIHLRLEADLSPDFWYEYDLSFLEHWAEAIYLLKGWENSRGSVLEKEYAEDIGLIVMEEDE